MDDQTETLTAKEAMEGVRVVNEMMSMFKACADKNVAVMPLFVKGAEGDMKAWFEGMDKVADLDVDEAQGCLISALTVIATIKVRIRGTESEHTLKDIFKTQES